MKLICDDGLPALIDMHMLDQLLVAVDQPIERFDRRAALRLGFQSQTHVVIGCCHVLTHIRSRAPDHFDKDGVQ
ncbi:MAG: hypothetical protein B7X90_02845 [Novosphingobium sp. 17-62-19]|nr:MAG: hypothetical protein B7X90_02845 [Novosphingobium sp. 17-62-19]